MCVAPSIVPEVGWGIAMVTPVPFGTTYGEVPGPLIGSSPTRQREGSRGCHHAEQTCPLSIENVT